MNDRELLELYNKLKPLLGSGAAVSGSGSGTLAAHSLGDTAIHIGTVVDSQAPQFLKADGSRSLSGNMTVLAGVMIDGVDISAHAADANAHHAAVTAADTTITVVGQTVKVNFDPFGGLENVNGLKVATNSAFNWWGVHTFNAGATIAAGQSLNFGADVALTRNAVDVLGLATGDAFQSSNYAAGVRGWKIDSAGNAEFESARIRGAIRAAVFEKSVVSAFAGSLIVSKSAGKLTSDFVVDNGVVPFANTAHLFIESPPGGGWVFDTNDIIRLKSVHLTGIGDTWGVVTRTAVENEYTVSIQYGTVNIAYPAGTALVDYGVSGQGTFAVSADGTFGASAAWVLQSHAGAPWTTTTTQVYAGTDGKLYAGAGYTQLDSNGISIKIDVESWLDYKAYRFINTGGTVFGGVYAVTSAILNENRVGLRTIARTGINSRGDIEVTAPSTYLAKIVVSAVSGLDAGTAISLYDKDTDANNQFITIVTPNVYAVLNESNNGAMKVYGHGIINKGLNVGTATGAAIGEIRASAAIRSNTVFNLNGTDGISNSAAGTPATMTVSGGIVTALTKVTPVANGTYGIVSGVSGYVNSITVTNGIITGISVSP